MTIFEVGFVFFFSSDVDNLIIPLDFDNLFSFVSCFLEINYETSEEII